MKIPVKNLSNETVREIELPEAVFDYPYKSELIHTAVVAILAAARRGTHKVKGRGEVRGSGRKLWRQKGTGRARMGSARSPLWRKGGVVHGPRPRNYEKGLSRREKRNALRSALSRKLADQEIIVLEGLDLESHKTAAFAAQLAGIGVDGKALLVDRHDNRNLHLASRNNPRLKVVDAFGLNVYDVVDRPVVVASEAAIGRLIEVLRK
jgi:large subunit ribosomal protein L4